MNSERFIKIMNEEHGTTGNVNGVLNGLNLINKYLPGSGIECAEHDIIYTVSVNSLVDAKILEDDVHRLRNNGWIIEYDCLTHFV